MDMKKAKEQIKNNVLAIKLYQDINDLINKYNIKYINQLFQTLGEYVKISKNDYKDIMEFKDEYENLNRSNFYNKMNNMSERNINDIKLYGVSYILEGLEYNKIFRKIFYEWLNLKNE